MYIRKKLRSYKDVVDTLERNGGKITLQAIAKNAKVDGMSYTGFSYSALLLYMKDKQLYGDAILDTSGCRGWVYDSLVANYRGNSWNEMTPSRLSRMPCAAFLLYIDIDTFMEHTLPVLNKVERRAGWIPSKAYVLNKKQQKVLLVGSKKWLRNAPLVSAYLLIVRMVHNNKRKLKGLKFSDGFRKISGPIHPDDYDSQMDGSAFRKLFYKDALHIMMTKSHTSNIVGSKMYKINGGHGTHGCGVGDFLASVHYLVKTADANNIKIKDTDDKTCKKLYVLKLTSNYGNGAYTATKWNATNSLHWNFVKVVAQSIQQRDANKSKRATKSKSRTCSKQSENSEKSSTATQTA